ncbi:MAG: hypothetical protein ACRDRL_25110 [Sciscionella sp.]
MGDSAPPPAGFDLVGSYARRRADNVEIVLSEPRDDVAGWPDDGLVLRMHKGRNVVDAAARQVDDGSVRRVVALASRQRLTNGTWSVQLSCGDLPARSVAARVLVQGQRPIALLWGASQSQSVIPTRRSTPKRRAVSAAGAALDRALAVLPPERAVRIREQARRAARRVLR